ncbi:hypothetical protein [Cytobacillus firmus]|uniref:hypothetical protein n=1 Tax=Cytobacillus firmus TaxID=1399 RepID=UPI0030030028
MIKFIKELWIEYKNGSPSTKLSIISSLVTLLGINALLAIEHFPFIGRLLIALPITAAYAFLLAVNINNYRLYKNKENLISNIAESMYLLLVFYPIYLLIKYLFL